MGLKRVSKLLSSVLYAFAKSERDSIDDAELEALRTIGANWLAASSELVGQAIEEGDFEGDRA
ncbi:hypothetical protein X773_28260 [Mesorhizobium sp. LSJC285A00]|uniref:hypothetical protein n=1 Tax=Mesorhizobium sp. LSJC285A00 TaxID=1287338 RepID=UPI0003CE8181|nr:hypothetical protein [Mesorhizobium sp. LSJC285A00]ESW70573.1 hypothetical protein X773_28260 [Mesorhizobium sp. LSJC285A00]